MGYLKAPKINTSARMTSAWASSELLYDTDLNAFYKGDGTTTGGVRIAEGDMASVLAVISALEARVSTLSATPPSVSVTSTKLSNALSNVRSVINIVSNNLSVVNAARVSSENVISNAVSVVSNALSVEIQTRSAQVASVNNVVANLQSAVNVISATYATSANVAALVSTVNVSIAAVSNAVSVVSNALSVETAARIAADNALSNSISNLTSTHNVLSNQVSQALSLLSAKNLSLIVSVGNSTSLEIQVSGVRTPHVQFDPTVSTPTTSIYSLSKDVTFNLLNYQALSALGIIIPQDDVWAVKNQSGSTILKGSPVMAVGTVGASGRILVDHMVADGTVSPKFLLGVAAHDMATGDDGYVLKKGKIKKLNTNAWPSGTVLYCDSATPGGFTSTIPQAPNLKLPVAFVVYQDTTNGIIAVRVTEGSRLSEDHDIELVSVTDGQLLKYNLSAKRWENWTPNYASTNDLSVVSAQAASAINVVSNALSAEIASRTSADTAINNAISNLASVINAVSAQNSVTSAELQSVLNNAISAVNVVSNALSTEIVNRVSSEAVINQNVSVLAQSLGATTSGLNIVSNALSNELSVRAAADTALSNAISAVSAQAASAINVVSVAAANALSVANVVSNAVSIVSVNAANALSVANAASNAVSVEIVNRTNADGTLSSAITLVSNAASNALSVANAASNAVSLEIVNRVSADNVLSVAIHGVSNAVSVEIVNRTSADNVLSLAINVVSNAASNALSVANAASNAASVVSNALSNAISNFRSADNVLSNQISVVSVAAANALSVANVVSNAVSVVSVALANEISARAAAETNILSIISVLNAKVNVSAINQAGTSVKGLQSVINALSNRISALSGASPGAVSVTSTELSAVSAQAASAINVISAQLANVSAINTAGGAVAGLQSVVNALSNRISAISATGGGGIGTVLSPTQITSWQNNYNPSSWGSGVQTLRLDGNSAFNFITGLTATTGGHMVRLLNVGSNPIGLYDANTNSTAANRFDFGGRDLVLLPGRALALEYDATSSRWRAASSTNIWAEVGEWVNYDKVELYHRNVSNIGAHHLAYLTASGTLAENNSGSGGIRPRIGVATLGTGTSSSSRAVLVPAAQNYRMYSFHDGTTYVNYHFFETSIRLSALSDAADIFSVKCGWLNSDSPTGIAQETNGLFLMYRHNLNSGQWVLRAVNNSTIADGNSSSAVAASTWYRIRIIVYPDGTAAAWVNGTQVATLATNNVPGSGQDCSPMVVIRKEGGTTGTNARSIDVDYMGLGTIYNSAR